MGAMVYVPGQAEIPKHRVSGWTRREMKLRARIAQAEQRAQRAERRVIFLQSHLAKLREGKYEHR
jgi:hypothetical protein